MPHFQKLPSFIQPARLYFRVEPTDITVNQLVEGKHEGLRCSLHKSFIFAYTFVLCFFAFFVEYVEMILAYPILYFLSGAHLRFGAVVRDLVDSTPRLNEIHDLVPGDVRTLRIWPRF